MRKYLEDNRKMPIFATASKEVSVYYGTLHRRESHISLLSL